VASLAPAVDAAYFSSDLLSELEPSGEQGFRVSLFFPRRQFTTAYRKISHEGYETPHDVAMISAVVSGSPNDVSCYYTFDTGASSMQMRWIDRAIKCCGGPIIFYSSLYFLLGVFFIVGSLYLDPDMGPVGVILLMVGVGILLLFFIMAFYKLRRNGHTKRPR
jgi:hypothetical protein